MHFLHLHTAIQALEAAHKVSWLGDQRPLSAQNRLYRGQSLGGDLVLPGHVASVFVQR